MTIPPGTEQLVGKILIASGKIYAAWKEKAEKLQQAEIDQLIASMQSSKPLGRRVEESLSRSLQSLRLSDQTLEALRTLDSDQVFHSEMATRLAGGRLSAVELAQILRDSLEAGGVQLGEIESIAAFWLEAIHMGIGESPSLSHALQIQSGYRLEAAVSSVAQNTLIVVEETKEIRQIQESNNSVAVKQLGLTQGLYSMMEKLLEKEQFSAPANAAQTILQKQFQSRFDKCRQSLIFGAIETAEQDFASLISDMVEAGDLASGDLLFRSYLNHSSSLLLNKRHNEAQAELERARQMFPDDNRFHRHHATLLSHEGKHNEALEIIRRLRRFEPDDPKNIADELALLHDLHRDEELEQLVDSVHIQDADVLCYKSYAFLRLKRFEDAVLSATSATQLKPDTEGPWITLAYSLGFPVVEHMESERRSQLSPTHEESLRLNDTAIP